MIVALWNPAQLTDPLDRDSVVRLSASRTRKLKARHALVALNRPVDRMTAQVRPAVAVHVRVD
jgi:hypothetical protein